LAFCLRTAFTSTASMAVSSAISAAAISDGRNGGYVPCISERSGTRALVQPPPRLLCIQIERAHGLVDYRMIISHPSPQKRFEYIITSDDPREEACPPLVPRADDARVGRSPASARGRKRGATVQPAVAAGGAGNALAFRSRQVTVDTTRAH
jgi:hypothetical protein